MPSSNPHGGPDSMRPSQTHETCSPNDVEHILFETRARLAGWDRYGRPKPSIDDDVARYMALEEPFVEWRDQLEAAAAEEGVERDEHGISPAMRAALTRFQTEGGHSSRMPEEKVRHIIRNGVIAFLELDVRKDLTLTLGAVCALSHAPWSTLEQSARGKHPMWPQYDWRAVMPDGAPDDQVEEEARKRLLIVRSSVLPRIEPRYFPVDMRNGQSIPPLYKDRDLRRLGLAGRGKYEVMRIAQSFGQEHMTFNIGALGIPGEKVLSRMSNRPSKGHNAWMREVGWRQHVDTILPETTVHKAITMYWARYEQLIDRGIQEFTLPEGLLEGKGYMLGEIADSARANAARMHGAIADGSHAPW